MAYRCYLAARWTPALMPSRALTTSTQAATSIAPVRGSTGRRARARSAEAWVSLGRPELIERLLFAFIEPPVPATKVSAFIRATLLLMAPLMPIELLPSSRGAMILRCASLDDRDSLRRLSPLNGEGSNLFLQVPKETTNRFYRTPTWLAFVAIADFPNEHWYESKIKQCFRGFCEVAEIDPACLTDDNFGPLRLLLEVNDRLEIPFEIRISSKKGVGRAGAVAKVLPIQVWPREYQLDSQGNLACFFGPPPPPLAGPSLGPTGPFSREQQLRPRPHHFYEMYPPQQQLNINNPQPGAPHDSLLPLITQCSTPASAVLGLTLAFARLLVTAPSAGFAASPVASVESSPAPPPSLASPAAVLPVLPVPESPAAPPPSLASPPPASTSPVILTSSPPLITYRRRPCARARTLASAAPSRHSTRIVAKAPASFVDMTTQAVQRKALLNSMSGCSVGLKKLISKKNILSRNKLPVGVADLRKLVSASRLGCKNVDVVGVVTDIAE